MENIYHSILSLLNENRSAAIRTVFRGTEGSVDCDMTRTITEAESSVNSRDRLVAAVRMTTENGTTTVSEPVLPEERLIILGGGHIAVPVARLGASCGFAVTVIDDRPAFANRERFPEARQVICDSFENGIDQVSISPYDYVVVITRGHRHDADCLRKLIPGTQPAYLGMIGSRRRVRAQMQMLKEEGYSAERLDKVCSPIGLAIGAVTPDEIAVSIMAEIISYRRLPNLAPAGHLVWDSDLELSMLKYLAENKDPKAIVTVIETKGSTPRGTGAKMAVSPIGQITGSIGGGCSEAGVIRDAIAIIGTGRYKVIDIDLTEDVAEEEGMVCGGTMKVLVEDYK